MTELSNTTAEHRPCWNLLYNCSEIGHTILEKWEKVFVCYRYCWY